MKKRILSISLVLAMVFSLLPMTALAELEDKGKIHGCETNWKEISTSNYNLASELESNTIKNTKTTVGYSESKKNTGIAETYFPVNDESAFEDGAAVVGVYAYPLEDAEKEKLAKQDHKTYSNFTEAMSPLKLSDNFSVFNGDITKYDKNVIIVDVKPNSDGDTHALYGTYLEIDKASKEVALHDSNHSKIKGVEISELTDMVKTVGADKNYVIDSLPSKAVTDSNPMAYVDAISVSETDNETKFIAKDEYATVGEVRIIEEVKANTNIEKAYEAGTAFNSDSVLPVDEEAARKGKVNIWFAVKVTAEDGETYAYHVGKIEVAQKESDEAGIASGKVTPEGESAANLATAGGSGTILKESIRFRANKKSSLHKR